MDKIERVMAVIKGEVPDRPPVSFWRHFRPEQASGAAAVEAHLIHFEKYDLDFVKVMNDNPYPRTGFDVLADTPDLKRIRELNGEEDGFGRQLEVVRAIRDAIGREALITNTVFSPWSVLRKLTAPENALHGPPSLSTGDARDLRLREMLQKDRAAVRAALTAIAFSLRNFAERCLEAGADGIFLSVRDDWVDSGPDAAKTYDDIVKDADLRVCEGAAKGTFNMLHVCGRALDFKRFAAYPCNVINWADRYAGPPIAEVRDRLRPAICGGVDNLNTLVHGTADDCRREVKDALAQAAGRPIIISAGCTYDGSAVPDDNLFAVRKAVQDP